MKLISIIAISSVLLASIAIAYTKSYNVKYIFDGDTILLYNDIKVRYIGIDAPEIDYNNGDHEHMALQSRDMNINLVHNQPIHLVFDKEKKDRYDRLLAYGFTKDGDMVNTVLLKHGLARIMVTPPNLKYFHALLKAQRHAISEGIGLWQKNIINTEDSYTGNKNSYRFHRPGCTFGKSILPQNRLVFPTLQDAFWEGFSPCMECMPDKELPPGQ